MKKFLLTVISVLALCLSAFGQVQFNLVWEKTYQTLPSTSGWSYPTTRGFINKDVNGDIYVIVRDSVTDHDHVKKISKSGKVLWDTPVAAATTPVLFGDGVYFMMHVWSNMGNALALTRLDTANGITSYNVVKIWPPQVTLNAVDAYIWNDVIIVGCKFDSYVELYQCALMSGQPVVGPITVVNMQKCSVELYADHVYLLGYDSLANIHVKKFTPNFTEVWTYKKQHATGLSFGNSYTTYSDYANGNLCFNYMTLGPAAADFKCGIIALDSNGAEHWCSVNGVGQIGLVKIINGQVISMAGDYLMKNDATTGVEILKKAIPDLGNRNALRFWADNILFVTMTDIKIDTVVPYSLNYRGTLKVLDKNGELIGQQKVGGDSTSVNLNGLIIDQADSSVYVTYNDYGVNAWNPRNPQIGGLVKFKITMPVDGVDELKQPEITFQVSPNPATDRLTFTCPSGSVITLTTMEGKNLLETRATSIDVSAFPAGAYVARVATPDGRAASKKLLIQR